MAPASGLSLSCRSECMGKVHFPWSFDFPIWLSMKSERGFAVLMPTGELQVLGAVFHQQCSSAGDRLSSAAAQSGTYQPNSGMLSSGPWFHGDWGLIPLEFSREFQNHICCRGVQNETHVGLCWGQPDLNPEKFESARFILGKEQFSLLHCLRKQCCGRNQTALGRWVKMIL